MNTDPIRAYRPRTMSEESKLSASSKKSFIGKVVKKAGSVFGIKSITSLAEFKPSDVVDYAANKEARFILNMKPIDEFNLIIKDLSESEEVYTDIMADTLNDLKSLVNHNSFKTLESISSSLEHFFFLGKNLVEYLKTGMKSTSYTQGAKEDPKFKFLDFMNAIKVYLSRYDLFLMNIQAITVLNPNDTSLMSIPEALLKPFVRAIEFRYAFNRLNQIMALDHSNSKKYNLDHEKCINLVLKLNELCEKVYSKFGMRDSFKDMVDFENNIDTTNVKDYKGITKINSISILLAQHTLTKMGLPVAPSFQTAIRFSLIKKMTAISKNDMKTQVGEPLIFHILSDTLIICKEATSKRNVELVYTPIPVIQITIMKIHGLLFDMKIGSSKIMSLSSDNAESIQSFIDTIEMMKLDMMAVFEVNSKSALNTNHSTARPSPQKTHGFIDKSTFKPIKLNLVDTVPKKSMHCPTTEVHANETISKVDIKKSSVQIGAHQVKLRSFIGDEIRYGYDEEENRDIKDKVMLAINEPKHIRGDLLNCVNQMRKPKETILVQEKCSLYRISPGDAEYKKIGIFLFTLTKYTLNDSSRSGLTVNDIQSGRLILSTNISPSLTLNANKDNKSFNINCIEEKQRTNLLKFKTQELADSIFMQLSIGVKDSIDAIHHELVADKLILVENSGDKSKSIPFMSFSNGIVSDTLFGKVSISFVQPESDIKADQIDDYTIGLVVIQSDLSSDIVFLKCQIRKDMISVTFEQGVILLKIMDSQEYCYKFNGNEVQATSLAKEIQAISLKNESILNELSNLKEVSEKSILSEILTRDEKSSDVRINYRAYLNPSSQKATSNATLTDELQKQPISNLEDCRSHSAQSLTICTKERTPSNTLNTRTLELFQEKLNKGEIDVIAQDLFKNYLTIPKDDIFESKIKSTITISTLHQIIQDLLIDSLKNREQLERLKPSRLIHDAKSSLTTNGIVDALL